MIAKEKKSTTDRDFTYRYLYMSDSTFNFSCLNRKEKEKKEKDGSFIQNTSSTVVSSTKYNSNHNSKPYLNSFLPKPNWSFVFLPQFVCRTTK